MIIVSLSEGLCSWIRGDCEGIVCEDISVAAKEHVATRSEALPLLSGLWGLAGDNGFYPTFEDSPLQEHTPVTSLTLDADIGT